MTATWKEKEWAQTNGVRIKHWARPVQLRGWAGGTGRNAVKEVVFEYTQLDEQGRLLGTGDTFTLMADQVFKAIGQSFVASTAFGGEAFDILETADGRIAVNDDRMTSLAGVFAGGDCIPGTDLTVAAVEDGKIAAHAIDRLVRG